jgi:hypothetical protein
MTSKYDSKNIFASEIGIAPISATFFTVEFRAAPGVDAIKAVRRLLKYALRQCGLRAASIEERHV